MKHMEAFRKGNSQREFHQSFRSQSAMEYLMTYGWAILIIAVVLAALFELGVFNPMTFAPKASPGSCQVVRPEGAGTTNFISLEGECNGELPQYAAQFNGQSSYITVNAFNLPEGSNERSVFGWIRINDPNTLTDGSREELFGYGSSGNYNIIYLMVLDGYVWADNFDGQFQSSLRLIHSSWYFIGYTYNGGTSNSITIYADSQSQTGSFSSPLATPTSGLAYIGYYPTFGQYANASIANIQVYDTVLSSNDVQALYQEGIGGAPINIQNLVGWWPLNGNANDYSGNGNNGVPSGVTYTSNWYSGYSAP